MTSELGKVFSHLLFTLPYILHLKLASLKISSSCMLWWH